MGLDGAFRAPQLGAWREAVAAGTTRVRSVHAPRLPAEHVHSERLRIAYLVRAVGVCSEVGADVLVVHAQHLFGTYEGTVAFLRSEASKLDGVLLPGVRDVLDGAAAEGVSLGLENERIWADPEDAGYLNTPENLLRCLRALDHPVVGATLDVCHAHLAGDLDRFVSEVAPWVVNVHVSDMAGRERRPPGQGELDWGALLPRFRRMPRLRALTLELDGGAPAEAIETGIGFLRSSWEASEP